MEKILGLSEAIRELTPTACYSSRLARALDTASVLANELDLEIKTIKGLGQYANKDGQDVHYYPGHEKEGMVEWQDQAVEALCQIATHHGVDEVVLIVSHRPSITGMVGHAKGIHDKDGLNKLIADPEVVGKPFVVLEVRGREVVINN
jgi:broad specificity phosphatase PhoE